MKTETATTLPLDRWIALDSLTSEQLQAATEGPFEFEWHHAIVNSRELLEVKITSTEPTS